MTHPGLAQSRHLCASFLASLASKPMLTSLKSLFLSSGSLSGIFWEEIFILSLAGIDFRNSFRHSLLNSALSVSLSSGDISFFSAISYSYISKTIVENYSFPNDTKTGFHHRNMTSAVKKAPPNLPNDRQNQVHPHRQILFCHLLSPDRPHTYLFHPP